MECANMKLFSFLVSMLLLSSCGNSIDFSNLQEGDIISKVGHVEIFCRNSGGKHYVYNAGGTDSINNPNATKTGHSSGYTTVWRAPGKSVDVNVTTSGKVSTSGTETSTATGGLTKYSAAISQLASEMLKPFQSEQTGDTTTSTSNDYSGADISGSDTAQKVWNFFTSIGYSKAATAGILGNLYQESGVNPKSNADKPNSPAAGIAQWENFKNKHGRWKKLSDYAASKGKKWTDLKSQLEFIDKESLPGCFREFAPYEGGCRFSGCAHYKEPGCAVRQAMEEGELEKTRYESYLRLYKKSSQIKLWELK